MGMLIECNEAQITMSARCPDERVAHHEFSFCVITVSIYVCILCIHLLTIHLLCTFEIIHMIKLLEIYAKMSVEIEVLIFIPVYHLAQTLG